VLIAGGETRNIGGAHVWINRTKECEVFDPQTGTTVAAAPLATARSTHTATLLADGRVLIVGGAGAWEADNGAPAAELFDPATGSFTAVPMLFGMRAGHTATLLRDGTVLIAGGRKQTTELANPILETERFDPESNTFANAGTLRSYRMNHTATLLRDGRVLLAGGGDGWGEATEIYDPAMPESFVPGPPMAEYRSAHTATLLPGGRVLLTGGISSSENVWRLASWEILETGPVARRRAVRR
jgi:hypothetical protein